MTRNSITDEPTRSSLVVEDPASGTLVPEGARAEAVTLKQPSARATRLDSVDLLRGIVMVIMALDHTRDFFHSGAALFDPTDLSKTTPALFFTRWLTHFCAPVFVFLAGTGAFLSLSRGRTKKDLSRFLLTRGLWLILLELTVMHVGILFDVNYHLAFVQVIWVFGWSMIVLAALIHLPLRAVAAFGVIMCAGHNALDRVKPETFGALAWLWRVLHVPGPISSRGGGFTLIVLYPLIPWIGVMAAGYAFGALLQLDERRRRKVLLTLGASLTLAFVLLRAANFYGDPQPWSPQPRGALYTFLSFFDCQKYPPSLLYLLMTLGPAITLLPLLERARGALARFFLDYGRVPLFYYILHFYLLHATAVAFAFARYGKAVSTVFANNPPPGYGYRLPVVYLVWASAVLALYFPCRYWANLKQRKRSAWLSYL